MQSRHKKRLIITLQLKNAEVYPGSNLHGTVILQLMHKHNSHRHRSSSIDSVDLTLPNNDNIGCSDISSSSLTIIDKVSISVLGICNINPLTEQTHFPFHLKSDSDSFNILRGKENILGHALQLKQNNNNNNNQINNINEQIQFDFIVQLPPVLPCSYCGYFIQYLYFAQLFVTISKHIKTTKCRVPFYVLPINNNNNHQIIPNLLTPCDLQERMSIFRKRKKINNNNNNNIKPSTPSTPTIHEEQQYHNMRNKPSPSLLLPASNIHSMDNKHEKKEEKEEKQDNDDENRYFYFKDGNNNNNHICDDFDELNLKINKTKIQYMNNNKFRISLDNKCIGILLLNDTIFCDGQCIEGYLSLYTPCIVRVTLIHIEKCGNKQKHITNCCSHYECCWYSPSFTFTLKIPNNAFKSFKSDLCQSSWSLNFQFAISKQLLLKQNKQILGYLNNNLNIWELHDINNQNNNNNNNNHQQQQSKKQIDKILKWELPIIVTTIHNPLRCVTRSNAVIVKC